MTRHFVAHAVRLFQEGKRVATIAVELNIGRGSVYRAIEAAGLKIGGGGASDDVAAIRQAAAAPDLR